MIYCSNSLVGYLGNFVSSWPGLCELIAFGTDILVAFMSAVHYLELLYIELDEWLDY